MEREDVSRVSVDTIADWQRIKNNYTEAAMASLEGRVTSSGLTRDEKEAVSFHMKKFIETTFAIAQPNLRVNGRNFEDLDENEESHMEDFDEVLDRAVWSLSDQRLKSDRDIAEKRRYKPKEMEALLQSYLREQEVFDSTKEMVHANDDIDGGDIDMDALSRPPRFEEVFQKTSALAEELHQSMPIQRERSERIKTVSTEVKALKI